MGASEQAMTKKRKPADFPAEKIEKPRDAEAGEGLPQSFKEAVKKGLDKKRKPQNER